MSTNEDRIAREANRLYWESDLSVSDVADRLEMSQSTLYRVLEPTPAGLPCPECGSEVVFRHRSAREAGEAECPTCGLESDVPELERTLEERAAALRRAADGDPGLDPAVEQEWDAGPRAPLRTESLLQQDRALTIAALAAAGLVVGTVAVFWSHRAGKT